MAKNSQYASIPINYLEIVNSSNEKFSLKTFKPGFYLKLSKHNPFKTHKTKNIIVKIKLDKNPYIEELLTKHKIGLNKEDGYNIYLKGNTIYELCTKEEAYLKASEQLHYLDEIKKLFSSTKRHKY